MKDYGDYSKVTIGDIIRLRRRLDNANIPPRRTDYNVIVGTWNIRNFGGLHEEWDENDGSPKRNLRSLAIIAEVIRRFDVVALQEVKQDTRALRVLLDDFLGPRWGVMVSDVSAGDKGNLERLAYVYDKRRVIPTGLAGEIVLPPTEVRSGDDGNLVELDPTMQFDRTPYIVGFQSVNERFALLTVHIRFGKTEKDRVDEIKKLSEYVAKEIRDRAGFADAEETNLILLGDFNINERSEDDILFQELLKVGLWVPEAIRDVKSTFGKEAKHYDQIAWFRDDLGLLGGATAGSIDFTKAVYKELTTVQMTHRVSDHFPLWVEFFTDRSTESMAMVLGLDPGHPNLFDDIPD